jgi:hypothetical protein
MPTPLPAGPWMRMISYWNNNNKGWQNELWFKVTGTIPSNFDIAALTAGVSNDYFNLFSDVNSVATTFDGIDCYFNNGTYTVSGETGSAGDGTVTGNTLPNEDAAIVTLSAGIGTRVGTGRIFLGGVPTTFVLESKLSTAGITAYSSVLSYFTTTVDYQGMNFIPSIWSRKNNALEPIKFTVLRPILGHRTRRRPRR